MGVTVCLPLFANPGQELEEGAAVKGQQLRDLAVELQERLQKAADTLDRLREAGWDTRMAMFDVLLLNPAVTRPRRRPGNGCGSWASTRKTS